jgi:hypothetical protein
MPEIRATGLESRQLAFCLGQGGAEGRVVPHRVVLPLPPGANKGPIGLVGLLFIALSIVHWMLLLPREVIEEFAYPVCIPYGWRSDRVLKPNCRHTPPITLTGVIEPASVRGQLSKSYVVQV